MTQKKTVLTEKEVRENLIPSNREPLQGVIARAIRANLDTEEKIDQLIAEALELEPEELESNLTDLEEMRVLAVNCSLNACMIGVNLVLDAQDSSCAVLFGSEE